MPRPTTAPSPWRELLEQVGGVQALADAVRVKRNTVYRWWTHGVVPGPNTVVVVNALFRIYGLEPPWEEP